MSLTSRQAAPACCATRMLTMSLAEMQREMIGQRDARDEADELVEAVDAPAGDVRAPCPGVGPGSPGNWARRRARPYRRGRGTCAAGSWPPRLPLRVLRCPPRGLIHLGLPPCLPLRVLRCPPRGLIHLGAARRWIALPPRLPLRVLRCPPRGLIHLGAARRWIALPPRLTLRWRRGSGFLCAAWPRVILAPRSARRCPM